MLPAGAAIVPRQGEPCAPLPEGKALPPIAGASRLQGRNPIRGAKQKSVSPNGLSQEASAMQTVLRPVADNFTHRIDGTESGRHKPVQRQPGGG